jgi:hypothetical protein
VKEKRLFEKKIDKVLFKFKLHIDELFLSWAAEVKLCRVTISVICGIENKTRNKVTEKDSAISDNKLKNESNIEKVKLINHIKFTTQVIVSLK